MSKGRKILREYAKLKGGKEAVEFVEVIPEFYSQDTLVTKDSNGKIEHTTIDYKDLFHMIANNKIQV